MFSAVERGVCRYGVVPLEEFAAGSAAQVYDLVRRHSFKIARSARLRIAPDSEADIRDWGNNGARYICISKNLEIYPGADRTSLMLAATHRPGSPCRILAPFFTCGLNIIKLESCPIPDRDSEFRFYFDLETSPCSEAFIRLVDALASISEEFQYLGSYSEVI